MKWKEKHSTDSLNFWMGKPPHIPVALPRWGSGRTFENPRGQAWALGDWPRAGVQAVGVPIRSWKRMAGDSPRQRLPGSQHPREPASWSSPSEAWRRFPGAVPFQLVSILKPGDNERPVSGASSFSFFLFFFSTVHAILRNSWWWRLKALESFPPCGNHFSFLRRLSGAFLGLSSVADAAWIHFFPGSSHTEAFGKGAGRQAWGGSRGKSRAGFPWAALYL